MTFSLESFNMDEAKAGFIDYSQPIPANTYHVDYCLPTAAH